MGELVPGDRRMLRQMRAERTRGTAAGRRLRLPEGMSFVGGDVHELLRGRGYVGGFTLRTDEDGGRFVTLSQFDDPSAWISGVS